MTRKASVGSFIDSIQDEVEQVESRNERGRQVDVGWDRQLGIVFRIDRVGGCENRRSRVQRGDDACFGDRDRLLFLPPRVSFKDSSGATLLTMTSCKTLLVASLILSNSSMQQTPPSERTSAPLKHSVSVKKALV